VIERYYDEELRYLYESGREFARAHPDRARYLDIDAVGDRDPAVERLFEGFAFLTARIRQKLDESLPQLTDGLAELLWPQLLLEVPSCALCEFRPRRGLLTEARVLPRGSEVLSAPSDARGTVCRFSTTHDVRLNPISLVKAERRRDSADRDVIVLTFRPEAAVAWQRLQLAPLRLYLHAETPLALALHRHLTTGIAAARLETVEGWAADLDPATVVHPGGMGPSEGLLPHNADAGRGFTLLQEYFLFPEKFLCVDLFGLERLAELATAPHEFSLSLALAEALPPACTVDTATFRLHCAPVVNLFRHDTEPLCADGRQSEYSLVGDAAARDSVAVHSVVAVHGIDRATGERRQYAPLGAAIAAPPQGPAYAVNYADGPDGKRRPLLTISPGRGGDHTPREETLSVDAWCSNGLVAREELREGAISRAGRGFPDYLTLANITRPTLPCSPPDQAERRWAFLAHLSATLADLADAKALRRLLACYDWSGTPGRERRIAAVSAVALRPFAVCTPEGPGRGVEYTVDVTQAAFEDDDDLHLFGQVLSEFLGRYVSVNSRLVLQFVLRPSGRSMRWDACRGCRWPL
jgi:type VI secretion system protein ImpG